jgi:hypothetical protein
MDFLQQKREEILETNNSAQRELVDYLESANGNITEISISESLNGEIDFSILEEMDFSDITHIRLSKGNITQIANLPRTLVYFKCSENLLTELPTFPPDLEELYVDHNYLKEINTEDTPNLKILNISHNSIQKLNHLPVTLEKLVCNDNQIRSINLKDLVHLKQLHCFNNKDTVFLNVPEIADGIVDLKLDPDMDLLKKQQVENMLTRRGSRANETQDSSIPTRTVTDLSKTMDEDAEEDIAIEKEHNIQIDFMDALHHYFRLKTTYEKEVHDQKKMIFKKSANLRDYKQKIAKFRPKCVNCKQPFGTLFSFVNHRYKALCGNEAYRCMNIDIYVGQDFLYLPTETAEWKRNIEDTKETFVVQKLNTLFSYVDERDSLAQFKEKLEEYNADMVIYKEIKCKYDETFDNTSQKESIDRKTEEMYALIAKLKNIYHTKINDTNRDSITRDIVEEYIHELMPMIRTLRMMKNKIMEFAGTQLIKYPYTLDQLQYTFKEDPRVIKFRLN